MSTNIDLTLYTNTIVDRAEANGAKAMLEHLGDDDGAVTIEAPSGFSFIAVSDEPLSKETVIRVEMHGDPVPVLESIVDALTRS